MKSTAARVVPIAPVTHSLGERISAIAAEGDPARRIGLVAELSYGDRLSIKNEMHQATDPIRRALLAGILEAANLEDRRQMIASQAAVHQQQLSDAARQRTERIERWAALPELVRALFLAADATPSNQVADALLELARLVQVDTAGSAPPEGFAS